MPDDLGRALHELADRAAASPRKVLCHRDFHSRNLMLPPDHSLAMVDIQDARWGPDSYDLASILRDAYIEMVISEIIPLIDERYPEDRALGYEEGDLRGAISVLVREPAG